jgi:hypothetical protein
MTVTVTDRAFVAVATSWATSAERRSIEAPLDRHHSQ